MSSTVSCKLDASVLTFLMIVDQLDLIERPYHIIFIEKLLFLGDIGNLHEILRDEIVDRFGRVSHECLALESSLFYEVWQSCAVVNVKMSQQQEIDLFWIDHVEVWQSLYAVPARMLAAIEHDLAALALYVDAAPSDFTSCSEGHDLDEILGVASLAVIGYWHLLDLTRF